MWLLTDALELLFMQVTLDVRIATFAIGKVWVCLAVSKVVSSFRELMRWMQTPLLARCSGVAESTVFSRVNPKYCSGRCHFSEKFREKRFMYCFLK